MSDDDQSQKTEIPPDESIHTLPSSEGDRHSGSNSATNAGAVPKQIGRYRVERVLGKGGFGLVYLAYDEQLQRRVAVKVPHPHLVSLPKDAEAYLTEARTVANLDNPHIVPVYDVGSSAEYPCYVVSKYVEGSDLAARLKQSRLPPVAAAELVATVAEALHAAHKQGLVHRDIKPGNILLDHRSQPFVVDFGLALRESDVGKGTRFCGTPAYMSPEQARGEAHRLDGRSDIFSLGIVLYELLAGRRPFTGDTSAKVMEAITVQEPRPLRQLDETIPKELERICLKAVAKRSAERYSSAHDLADDLRHFLSTQSADPVGTGSASTILMPSGAISTSAPASGTTAINSGGDSARATASSEITGSQPIRIVPKGLRSFDAHDADFFLELLPGPCDRDGLPDSLRFWKTRIEETDPDNTFSVGLIYGPSGCGKSSLMKAGLLPRLSNNVIAVYVEATAEETELRVLNGLRKRIPALPANLGLKETLAALRQGQGLPVGKKVLIVIDQFEQWLHAKKEEKNTELVQALRQCDGGRLQCIVMVRDDFWLAVSRFLRDLENRLVEGQNSALVDLFDLDHARKVLAALGRAFGKLPENSRETSTEQKDFLQQAVTGLAQEGKVICVRLALFAEMMKGKPWTPAGLKEVGGTSGVGAAFLEETFSATTAPPEHRYHQKGARGVLKCLLPETGTDIKGHMRSYSELLEAAGYANRPKDFDDLVHVLDDEVRLITPTDPEGAAEEVEGGGWRVTGEANVASTSSPASRYFQLTHDYLVPSLRDWLTRKQKETRRGRAELRLAERTALWQSKPEARHLPSWWEYLSSVWLIPKKNRTAIQQKMLRKAGRVHAVRWGSALAALLVIGLLMGNAISKERQNSLRSQVLTAVDSAQFNRGFAVPVSLKELKKLPRDMVADELKKRYPNAKSQNKLGLAYALAAIGDVDIEYLCSEISRASHDEVDNLVTAFGASREASLSAIFELANAAESEQNWRLKTRYAIVGLHLNDDRLASDMCQIQDRPDPTQRTMFIDTLPTWHGNVATLATYCQTLADPALNSGVCLGIGGILPESLNDEEYAVSVPVLKAWYESAPENLMHSSSLWALRQWRIELPQLPSTVQPSEKREWFVNSQDITLLKIHPGVFVRKHSYDDSKPELTVTLTREFFLSDREISFGQFRLFIDDATYPIEEKPTDLTHFAEINSQPADHPVRFVNWFDAVLFCNWLSRKEGYIPCYERTGQRKKYKDRLNNTGDEVEIWRLSPTGTGYRLPSVAEWEYASHSGATTSYPSGSDIELFIKYAVFQAFFNPSPVGSKLPNRWGLFDTFGNIAEISHEMIDEKWFVVGVFDFLGEFGAIDPIGPSDGARYIGLGGCFAQNRPRDFDRDMLTLSEVAWRSEHHGFRLALSSTKGALKSSVKGAVEAPAEQSPAIP